MIKKVFYFLALVLGLSPLLALAQTGSITVGSTFPGTNPSSTGPWGIVNNFYSFALLISGFLAFAVIVYGGVKYATGRGNPTAESEGRAWITGALLGLLLLVCAYIILNTINPNILNGQLPSISTVGVVNAPGATSTGVPNARCQAPKGGPCSQAALANTCFANNAQLAGGVCNVESNGNAAAGGDKCDSGSPASIGLFQINLSAKGNFKVGGTDCSTAFSNAYTGSNPHCTVTNQALYNQCVAAAQDAAANIATACGLSQNGTNFNLWGPATKQACGL